MDEVKRSLQRAGFDAGQPDGTSLPIRWNGEEIGTITENGSVRYRSEPELSTAAKEALEQVTEITMVTREYMTALETAPPLDVVGLSDRFKILADFNSVILAGRYGKNGVNFVTWNWDYDRKGVNLGHYFMSDYKAAKQAFAVRAGLVNSQLLFSDEQLRVIYDACQFSLGEAALSIPEEKQLNAVSRQIESLFPALEQHEQQSGIEQTM